MTMNNPASHPKYYLVGVGNSGKYFLDDDALRQVTRQQVFSGGDRHYALVKNFLPAGHRWIPINGKMEDLLQRYERNEGPVVIFTSGDPFFFGLGSTLRRLRPHARVKAFPYFNCIQLLAHQLQYDYTDIVNVSVHGRDWCRLDQALLSNTRLIGVLTDRQRSPAKIAERMLEYGFENYTMTVGEELEGASHKISRLSLAEAKHYKGSDLNCLVLERIRSNVLNHGLADEAFTSLPGRPGMITKRPTRLATLSVLQLHKAGVFWDVGSCTGSIAIEAKRMFPALTVIAFEKRKECESIIQCNAKKFHAPGIQLVTGDIFCQQLSSLPSPDAIFIGGHGDRLEEMITVMDQQLSPGGMLVINTVKKDSEKIFLRVCERLAYPLEAPVEITVNHFNPIKILTARKPSCNENNSQPKNQVQIQ